MHFYGCINTQSKMYYDRVCNATLGANMIHLLCIQDMERGREWGGGGGWGPERLYGSMVKRAREREKEKLNARVVWKCVYRYKYASLNFITSYKYTRCIRVEKSAPVCLKLLSQYFTQLCLFIMCTVVLEIIIYHRNSTFPEQKF